MKVLEMKKNKTPEEIKNIQSECLKLFSDLVTSLDGMKTTYKDEVIGNCQEDLIKMLCGMGFQKEIGWILEIIESNKRLYETLDTETKVMRRILKTANKGR